MVEGEFIETQELYARLALADCMKAIRLSLDLSQIDLAKTAEISRTALSAYENNYCLPSLEAWTKWLLAVSKAIIRLKQGHM